MNRKLLMYFIISGLMIFGIYISVYIYGWEYRSKVFEVNFFSLNKGRAIFIRTPDNKTILVGGGQNSDTIRSLTKVMPFYSKKIDYIFVPSATPAQIGGLIEIIDRYEIDEIFMPKIMATSTVLTQLMKGIRNKKIHIEEIERGDEKDIGSLNVKVLFPSGDYKFNKTSLPELGLSFEYKNTSLYLIGNLSKTIQKDIAKDMQISDKENIVEYYNTATDSKVSKELMNIIKPKFVFSTKEKSTSWFSDGFSWIKK